MKRILALLLAVLSILSLAACGGQSLDGTETGTVAETKTESTAQTKTEEPANFPKVLDTKISEKIAALPVANASMSTAELRQLCLDFFAIQLSFAWTPNKSFSYERTVGNNASRNVGTVYGGIPYVHSTSQSLYSVLTFYDEATGVMDIAAMGASPHTAIGNQCSGSSFWAWARISNTMNWHKTVEIVAKNGAIPVGPYTYDENLTNFSKCHTGTICVQNGPEVMYQSYAKLQPADGIVYYDNGGGHVAMIQSCHVEYKDGAIDPEASYVIIREQRPGDGPSTQTDGSAITIQLGITGKHSFSNLWKKTYIPFTLAEFLGQDPIEEGSVTLGIEEESTALDTVINGTMTASYAISHIKISVLDKDGNEAVSKYYYLRTMEKAYRTEVRMMDFGILRNTFSDHVTDGARIRVEAQLGNGEYLCAYEGNLTK